MGEGFEMFLGIVFYGLEYLIFGFYELVVGCYGVVYDQEGIVSQKYFVYDGNCLVDLCVEVVGEGDLNIG